MLTIKFSRTCIINEKKKEISFISHPVIIPFLSSWIRSRITFCSNKSKLTELHCFKPKLYFSNKRRSFRATLLDPRNFEVSMHIRARIPRERRVAFEKGTVRRASERASEWTMREGEKVEKATETERSKDGVIAERQGLLDEFGGTF